jgi:hypothetical protein
MADELHHRSKAKSAVGLHQEPFHGSPYAEIDGAINGLLLGTGWTLHTEWAGRPARYFQVPADPPLECFQLSVSPPVKGHVTVFAAAVDKEGDSELEESWHGPVSKLNSLLSDAIATIQEWENGFGQTTTLEANPPVHT